MSTVSRNLTITPTPPPYLFTAPQPGAGAPPVTVTADFDTTLVEIAVHGRWARGLGADVSAAIGKCLAEPPAAVITDLHDLGDPDAASLPLWLAARRAVSLLHPCMPFAVCLPTATALNRRLRQVAAARHLPLFATMAEARTCVIRRLPPAPRLHTDLPPHPQSAAVARDLVTQAGDTWQLPPSLLMRAKLVMSELVGNAVEHAGTDIHASVSPRGSGLHLAVRDGVTHLPYLRQPHRSARSPLSAPPETGLGIVHAGADTWGALPTPGGKIVWAVIHPRPGD
ncbi:ATP-binding protein [Paractinoplanes rishiriensis]|uniref:Histidine kinase/HSP90-like ATPase domain-containing protein n=1 Tax=Paractinoplanes rishiriensis TaxID=1050105 RepID=A0A919KAP4_9ACTN|nr:ATP-binding protein [Actinoplanes rishiriensis]GIF01840.1 hypothetical protein Ari01nite_93040 [Actinoplanes rishiriensis]